ncbi:MAG TPA: polysaccharide biosynthesis/export family protein [Gemmatimonadales bacterium]|nr:polysaccharide biosynthesis/export family protein [Gemmatimonadales bacterium]
MRVMLAALVAATLLSGSSAMAQSPANHPLATREDLEAILARSGKQKLGDRDRQFIEARLRDGDFKNGDRLLVRLRGDSAIADTFAIRTDRTLTLPDMPPLDMKGVLRSEAKERIQTHIAQFIRNPQVDVEPLLRLGLLGSVQRPGYYNVRADVPVSEVVMVAGGMGGDADFKKMTVQRGKQEIYDREHVRQAMADGMSLDQLGIQNGDEIAVGARSTGFVGALPVITGIAALAAAIISISIAL